MSTQHPGPGSLNRPNLGSVARRFSPLFARAGLLFTRGFGFCSLTALFLVMASCSVGENVNIARSAVEQFHNQYNTEQYRQTYVASEEEFQEAVSEADFAELMAAMHRKLGRVKETSLTGFEVNWSSSGTQVQLSYDTTFAEGGGFEDFVWRVRDNQAKLIAYNISSIDLVRK